MQTRHPWGDHRLSTSCTGRSTVTHERRSTQHISIQHISATSQSTHAHIHRHEHVSWSIQHISATVQSTHAHCTTQTRTRVMGVSESEGAPRGHWQQYRVSRTPLQVVNLNTVRAISEALGTEVRPRGACHASCHPRAWHGHHPRWAFLLGVSVGRTGCHASA